jgi:hypothetical protein
VEVFRLEEISHVLGLGVLVDGVVVIMAMAVVVRIVRGADVVHLVGGSALHAARLGLLAGEGDPENAVGVGGETGAADVLLVASRVDGDGILWGACVPSDLISLLSHPDYHIPRRLASSGLMSKISTPCIFPRISRRSRPVACSRSVGTVPGCAPGAKRSASDLISVDTNCQPMASW